MSGGDALEARVVELETRIAFLEGMLSEMSDALAASRIEAQRNADLFRRVLEEMKSARAQYAADPAEEPPPPHY